MKKRIYICHTFYHVYIACLKELNLLKEERGQASLMLSSLSNDFGNLKQRVEEAGLFGRVINFDEKEESFFPQLKQYHKDRGNILKNMLQRIRFTRLFGKLLEPYIPVDLKEYEDIYVFCDSDPIGYYLNTHKIYYHALEDGLDCIRYYDTARYDNRGHFKLKAWLAARNLIFIQNGYAKYCLDMEVNDCSVLEYPCKKYLEKPRKELAEGIGEAEKEILLSIFIENWTEMEKTLKEGANHERKILILTEPLCDLETRKRIFEDIIREYKEIDGKEAQILLKPHPRDLLNYEELFPEYPVFDQKFPMEIFNYIKDLSFDKVISVFTVPDGIQFAKEKVFLGEDFMDRYEAPEIHRQNEMI